MQSTSRHHLVPREEGGKYGPTVELCQPCHSSVHRFLSNREPGPAIPHGRTVALGRGIADLSALDSAPAHRAHRQPARPPLNAWLLSR
ncbi:hypothetical protein ACFQT0_19870 [Hymenobacter humi]|uniref:HNH endonuclease n=1 Tax=Hymenobacter humi TaxID=1411620 RepID=A0ABW2U8Z9_9BACT